MFRISFQAFFFFSDEVPKSKMFRNKFFSGGKIVHSPLFMKFVACYREHVTCKTVSFGGIWRPSNDKVSDL